MFRFVTLAAVSSDEQIDKASIPSQLELTRAAGERLGGQYVHEYVIDGYSRTAYYDLSKALQDIPPLKQCIDAMGMYDVLIVKNYDRLGSLGMPLYYFFCQYRKQLYSVQQATQIHDPETYSPSADISVPSMIISASQNQVYRIAKITDAFKVGNKARAVNGLYAIRIPYGYVKLDKEHIELVPQVAALLVQFPAWYLSGASLMEIARRADASGVPPPARARLWNRDTVRYILRNPFYAGKTAYGKGRIDKVTKLYKFNKNVEYHDGKHEALWSYETHCRILAELERRHSLRHSNYDYNFTGLLKCAVCGATLTVLTGRGHHYWSCTGHVTIRTERANALVAEELRRLFASDAPVPRPATPPATLFGAKELSAVRRQLVRLEQAYESGAYTVEEFTEKRKAMKAREAELLDEEKQRQAHERKQAERVQAFETMREFMADSLDWVAEQQPQIVKFHLSQSVTMVAYPDKHIELTPIL